MQLSCPECATAFRIDPVALGTQGRSVRCVRCRTTWFARVEDLVPEAAMAEALVEPGLREVAPPTIPPQVVPWNDTDLVETDAAPSIAPALAAESAAPPILSGTGQTAVRQIVTPRPYVPAKRKSETRIRLALVSVILATIAIAAVGQREAIVRALPELAGFYEKIGFPVNLRGLEFNFIRTSLDTQAGVPVLVVEGEVVNVTRQTVGLPRLRFAVLGADDKEIYAWTSVLSRESLGPRDVLPFRSQLASPPEGSKRVFVRFLTPADLADGL
jgi:predicted Zn finger-like uncharacterized protein